MVGPGSASALEISIETGILGREDGLKMISESIKTSKSDRIARTENKCEIEKGM